MDPLRKSNNGELVPNKWMAFFLNKLFGNLCALHFVVLWMDYIHFTLTMKFRLLFDSSKYLKFPLWLRLPLGQMKCFFLLLPSPITFSFDNTYTLYLRTLTRNDVQKNASRRGMMRNTCCLLTLETRLPHGKHIPFALDDFEFDVPFDVLFSDCVQTTTNRMSVGPIDVWFVNFSNYIP